MMVRRVLRTLRSQDREPAPCHRQVVDRENVADTQQRIMEPQGRIVPCDLQGNGCIWSRISQGQEEKY